MVPKQLIEYFKTPYNAFNAEQKEYRAITRKPEPLADKNLDYAMDIVEYVKTNNVGVITYNDPRFPNSLKKLNNCPIVLYYIGNLYDFNSTPSIGVVGTRNYTANGERVTKRISYDLARSGFTIVSGLAKGIDAFGHKAALYNKSMTTAVLGCGIDVIYPKDNSELTLRMHEKGLVITEFAPGTAPIARNFPARNRIISALSDGIFVAECTLKSGTLITADHAFKNNIPVYMYDSIISDAKEYLKTRGAVSITSADDITSCFRNKYPRLRLISELGKEGNLEPEKVIITRKPLPKFGKPAKINPQPQNDIKPVAQKADVMLDEQEKYILEKLLEKDCMIDDLINDNINVTQVLRSLTSLEMKKFITSLPGGKYTANF